MELVEKYSEQKYYHKDEVLEEFGYHVGNIMWDEIEAYRKIFRLEIPLFSSYITLCRKVVFEILKTEKMLYQINGEGACNRKDTDKVWDLLQHRLDSIREIDITTWFQDACRLLGVHDVEFVDALFHLEIPLTLKMYLCLLYDVNHNTMIARLYLMKEKLPFLYELLHDVSTLCKKSIDITYGFLAFLGQIELKISTRMVLLNSDKKLTHSSLSFTELKECYPQLSDEQIKFYLAHHTLGQYYSIQQFIQCFGVCYETARQSMDKLVEVCWYQKRRLGKKFVYFI